MPRIQHLSKIEKTDRELKLIAQQLRRISMQLKAEILDAYAAAYRWQDFERCEQIYLANPDLQDDLDNLLNELA